MARLSALIRQLIFQYILHFNTVLKPPEHFWRTKHELERFKLENYF